MSSQKTAENGTKTIAEQQATQFADAVGSSIPKDVMSNAQEHLQTAPLVPIYKDHDDIPFLFEILENDGWKDAVQSVLEAWLSVGRVLAEFGSSLTSILERVEPPTRKRLCKEKAGTFLV